MEEKCWWVGCMCPRGRPNAKFDNERTSTVHGLRKYPLVRYNVLKQLHCKKEFVSQFGRNILVPNHHFWDTAVETYGTLCCNKRSTDLFVKSHVWSEVFMSFSGGPSVKNWKCTFWALRFHFYPTSFHVLLRVNPFSFSWCLFRMDKGWLLQVASSWLQNSKRKRAEFVNHHSTGPGRHTKLVVNHRQSAEELASVVVPNTFCGSRPPEAILNINQYSKRCFCVVVIHSKLTRKSSNLVGNNQNHPRKCPERVLKNKGTTRWACEVVFNCSDTEKPTANCVECSPNEQCKSQKAVFTKSSLTRKHSDAFFNHSGAKNWPQGGCLRLSNEQSSCSNALCRFASVARKCSVPVKQHQNTKRWSTKSYRNNSSNSRKGPNSPRKC